MQVDLIANHKEIEALGPAWRALFEESAWPNVFLTWEWASACYHHWGGQACPVVLALREHGELHGIAPLLAMQATVADSSSQLELHFATHPGVGEYADLLASAGCEEAVARAALEWLAAHPALWRRLELPRLRTDSPTLAILRQGPVQRYCYLVERPRPPSLCIELLTDWESLIRRSGRLKRIGQYMRKCVRELGVRLEVLEQPQEIEAGLQILFDLHTKRWEQREGESNFLPMRDFILNSAWTLAPADLIRVFVLRAGNEEPLAAWLAYVCRDQVFSFQTGFDPQWESYRVGAVLLGFVLQHAIEHGYREFDFLGGDAEYKHYWSNATRAKTDLTLFPGTGRGAWCAARTRAVVCLRRMARHLVGRERRRRVTAWLQREPGGEVWPPPP